VALLYGGRSGEHEISLRSAEWVRTSLDRDRYEILDYFIDKNGRWDPAPILPEPGTNGGIDVVFPMLHGPFGEDGTVQGLLELAALPYVGAGVLASALSMDKTFTKRICREAGLPIAEFVILYPGRSETECVELPFSYPVFVKPANLGSSVGITKVSHCRDLPAALREAAQYDRKVVIERGISGREFECAVLGGEEALPMTPCEIIPSQEFYTYDDKYILDEARTELPAKLDPEQIEEIRNLAKRCFEAVGCEGMARVDFLMESATGRIFINEINTIPGCTSISMFPKMCEHSGISNAALVDRLIDLALERAKAHARLRHTK